MIMIGLLELLYPNHPIKRMFQQYLDVSLNYHLDRCQKGPSHGMVWEILYWEPPHDAHNVNDLNTEIWMNKISIL